MKRFIIVFIITFSILNLSSKEFKMNWTNSDPYKQIELIEPNTWRLTKDTISVKSAIWNTANTNSESRNLNLDTNFCIEFQMQFSTYVNPNDAVGADGIAFVLRNPSIMNNYVGGWGRGIGYQYVYVIPGDEPPQPAITHSLAVEFDTYYNDSYDQEIDNKENVARYLDFVDKILYDGKNPYRNTNYLNIRILK